MVFSKCNSVPTQSQLSLSMSHYPLDLEVDLDAEIRSKKLSTVEETKEYTVELSNLTMQDLRVRNNNGTMWIHCRYNDVRHPKKEESVHVGSLSSCIRREALDCSRLRLKPETQ